MLHLLTLILSITTKDIKLQWIKRNQIITKWRENLVNLDLVDTACGFLSTYSFDNKTISVLGQKLNWFPTLNHTTQRRSWGAGDRASDECM